MPQSFSKSTSFLLNLLCQEVSLKLKFLKTLMFISTGELVAVLLSMDEIQL